ncbi:ATP synthase F1 subunit gamma [Opitutus sp. GAS368]|jgi:F-type H+-transporting ATPase subunit gamma|uniref:ATP synthase F1 subunit gamma n=1 Tax=Opitutus sp. GAS368 TaxID=1882749 RepID=UPI00087CC5A5|nr:ATP synthase F1 subunit gamma [Opitutus sp. GAS368]SDR95080.1 F-type H+-transporting ATPase subunit gamma [Opitutus sp. GAS368]
MASTRDIRRRIKSVKNTRQITKAMELVAASKMKKAQSAALAGRPYAQLMADMLAALAGRVENIFEHPLIAKREVKTRGILVVSTDKGLCGPLNANLFKLVTEIKTPAKYVAIGRKGAQFLARTKRDILADFTVSDRAAFNEVKVVVEFMVKLFLEGTIDTVEVIYPRYKNTLVQEAIIRPVLPLTNVREFIAQNRTGADGVKFTDDRDMLFEPDVKSVLEALLPFYVNRYIYQLVLSAKASEQSARMVAMKTAKDNATKLLGDLTLEYNKARQAGITQEILEIAAAAFSAT